MSTHLKKLKFLHQDCADLLIQQPIERLEKIKNKTIYIAGGTGFVGTWVATMIAYLNQHHGFKTKVFLLARNPERLHNQVPHLLEYPEIQIIKQDVRNIFELPPDVNYVLHLACSPDSRGHSSNPFDTASTIVDGTKNLLSISRYCPKLENFLYLSSASIYGNQPLDLKHMPESFNESAPKCNNLTATYAEAKRFAEMLCTIFRSQFRLPLVIARPFAFVGPFQSLDRPWAINNFMHNVLQNHPIQILGDGKTIRSYLYGSDVAYWVLSMLLHGQNGDIFNLGSDQEIGLNELAHLILTEAETSSKIQTERQLIAQQPSRLIPSIELAKKELKLKVTVSLQDAIKKTLKWNA